MVTLLLAGTIGAIVNIAAGPFDGVYTGTRSVVRGVCGALQTPSTMYIRDGQVLLMPQAGMHMTAPVAPDGSFSVSTRIQIGREEMRLISYQGKVSGNNLTLDEDRTICAVHFALTKRSG